MFNAQPTGTVISRRSLWEPQQLSLFFCVFILYSFCCSIVIIVIISIIVIILLLFLLLSLLLLLLSLSSSSSSSSSSSLSLLLLLLCIVVVIDIVVVVVVVVIVIAIIIIITIVVMIIVVVVVASSWFSLEFLVSCFFIFILLKSSECSLFVIYITLVIFLLPLPVHSPHHYLRRLSNGSVLLEYVREFSWAFRRHRGWAEPLSKAISYTACLGVGFRLKLPFCLGQGPTQYSQERRDGRGREGGGGGGRVLNSSLLPHLTLCPHWAFDGKPWGNTRWRRMQ